MDTTIRTKRLDLRLLSEDDIDDVFAYASDPAVAENTTWFPHRQIGDTKEYVGFVVGADSDVEGSLRHVWAIRRRGKDRVIGTIDLIQDSRTQAHVDFALAQADWGQGIATEATRAVVGWGFSRLPDLEEVRSGGLSRNVGTMRVLEKVGFRLRSRANLPRSPKFADEPLEASHFVLTRGDFYGSGREKDGPRVRPRDSR